MRTKNHKLKPNIVLIGYRGTGKSVTGKILAERLNMNFLSTDKLIIDEMGMSIAEAVQRFGWNKFRDVESKIVKQVSIFKNCVIDCGGGIVENYENIKHLKKKGNVILLEADIKNIIDRIKADTSRPPLKEGLSLEEEVGQMLKRRNEKYRRAADYTVNTSNIDTEGVVSKIFADFLSI